MAKIADLSKGDRVRWGTSQGKTTGTVVGIKTKPFSIKGTDLTASKDDPKVLVESEKTGAQAGHKPSALSKLKARATGAGKAKETGKASGTAKGTGTSKAKDTKSTKTTKAKDTSKAKDSGKAKRTSTAKDAKGSAKSNGSAKRKATKKSA